MKTIQTSVWLRLWILLAATLVSLTATTATAGEGPDPGRVRELVLKMETTIRGLDERQSDKDISLGYLYALEEAALEADGRAVVHNSSQLLKSLANFNTKGTTAGILPEWLRDLIDSIRELIELVGGFLGEFTIDPSFPSLFKKCDANAACTVPDWTAVCITLNWTGPNNSGGRNCFMYDAL